jgi:hypothetical protein
VRKGSGVLINDAQEVPFTDVLSVSLPAKLRWAIDLDKRISIVHVINGNQGWRQSGGAVNDMTKEGIDEVHEEMYVWYLTTLLPLKKEGVELAPVAEIKVDGKPAVGLRVTSRGNPQARLYFDKATGILLKIARTGRNAGLVVGKEYLFSGYKDFDGARLPTKYVELINGQKNNELKTATYELRKLEDSVFQRP